MMSEKYGEDQPWHLTQEQDVEPSYEKLADRIEELEAELEKQIGYKWDYRVAYIQTVEELEAKLAKAVDAGVDVAASLTASISLLEGGGKKAAASDKMFFQMLADYNASLDRFRTTLAGLKGGSDGHMET